MYQKFLTQKKCIKNIFIEFIKTYEINVESLNILKLKCSFLIGFVIQALLLLKLSELLIPRASEAVISKVTDSACLSL
jgi:hypothetical protein